MHASLIPVFSSGTSEPVLYTNWYIHPSSISLQLLFPQELAHLSGYCAKLMFCVTFIVNFVLLYALQGWFISSCNPWEYFAIITMWSKNLTKVITIHLNLFCHSSMCGRCILVLQESPWLTTLQFRSAFVKFYLGHHFFGSVFICGYQQFLLLPPYILSCNAFSTNPSTNGLEFIKMINSAKYPPESIPDN